MRSYRLVNQCHARYTISQNVLEQFYDCGFGDIAQLDALPMSWQTAARLMPVATSMAGTPPTLRVMRLLRMLSSVAAWTLISGPPDATLDLLESAFSA